MGRGSLPGTGSGGGSGTVGPAGPTGPTGPAGAAGSQGPTGPTGAAGTAGATGAKGADGQVISNVVNHGTNASTARPNITGPVIWTGSVDPANALATDFYWPYAGGGSSFTGPMDAQPAMFRAYSTRRLLSSYTGPAFKVRNSSTNTETDIGFLSTGELDTTALGTAIGSNSGYVTTWYDQSGNARHLTQATAANQPRIVNAGTTDLIGTKPAISFDGAAQYLFSTVVGLWAAGADSIAAVINGSTATNGTLVSESNAATAGGMVRMIRASSQLWNVQSAGDNGTSNYASSAASSNLFDGAAHQAWYSDTGSAISTWKDGTAIHAALSAPRTNTMTPTRFVVGASLQSAGAANFAPAKVGELLAWASDQTAIRTAVSTSQKAAWGTP